MAAGYATIEPYAAIGALILVVGIVAVVILVVAGAVLIQLALGAIYAWSVFTARLTDPEGAYGFTASETAWGFSAGLATFALVMVIAGRLLPQVGPGKLAGSGGLLLGTGYLLGGLFGNSFWGQLLGIGVIGGAGIGLGYVVPIAVGVKWFPDKKGLITGLAVAGFGFGATIWVKLAGSWFGGLLNTTSVFGLPGVQSVFVLYGLTFALLVLAGGLLVGAETAVVGGGRLQVARLQAMP